MNAPRHPLYYVEWLRVVLISLVVAHHAGQAYGPTGGSWPVFEAERSALLGPFFAVNAGFLMGMLFFIAGYFVPGSIARKGTRRFVSARLVRLGIPSIIFGFGVFALLGYGDLGEGITFWSYYWNVYIGRWHVEFGHLWFVVHLLAYSIIYAAAARLLPSMSTHGEKPAPGHWQLIGLVVIIAVIGGVVRIDYPQDQWVRIIGMIPAEPAHLPQYIIMFVVGTIAGRNAWFDRISSAVAYTWLGIGLAAATLMYALGYLASYSGIHLLPGQVMGIVFPLWEAVLCVGLSFGLIGYARDHWNHPNRWLTPLAGATYGVYLIHVFFVVGVNMALLGLPLPPFVKFLIVTALALLLSFSAIIALRKIPGVTWVL
jgi:peptidoglycan/LPS O-acetylase OafA/YrhL